MSMRKTPEHIKASLTKKGIFFTLISILIIEMVVMSYLISIDIDFKRNIRTVENSIKVADFYNKRIREAFLDKILTVISYKAMIAITNSSRMSNTYYSDLESFNNDFSSVVISGTLASTTEKLSLGNNTLNATLATLSHVLNDTFHLDVGFSPKKLFVFQSEATGPWYFGVNLSLDYFVKSNFASWNKTNISIAAMVPIVGLIDPYYLRHTDGSYPIEIRRSYEEYAHWDLPLMLGFLSNHTYRHDAKATSFLSRLVNNHAASGCCGIFSLIDQRDMPSSNKNESYADYCFFGRVCHGIEYDAEQKIYHVRDIPDEFKKMKLDMYHIRMMGINASDEFCQYNDPDAPTDGGACTPN